MAKCLTLAFISIIILMSKASYPLESAMHKAEVAKCYILSSFFSSNAEIMHEGIKEYSQNIYDKAVLKIPSNNLKGMSIIKATKIFTTKSTKDNVIQGIPVP